MISRRPEDSVGGNIDLECFDGVAVEMTRFWMRIS